MTDLLSYSVVFTATERKNSIKKNQVVHNLLTPLFQPALNFIQQRSKHTGKIRHSGRFSSIEINQFAFFPQKKAFKR